MHFMCSSGHRSTKPCYQPGRRTPRTATHTYIKFSAVEAKFTYLLCMYILNKFVQIHIKACLSIYFIFFQSFTYIELSK